MNVRNGVNELENERLYDDERGERGERRGGGEKTEKRGQRRHGRR